LAEQIGREFQEIRGAELSFFESIRKPEYVFRPSQAIKRLGQCFTRSMGSTKTIQLPWGLPITVSMGDVIGKQIIALGVFELVVSEVLWRLIDADSTVLDVGSNIGYMTSLMIARVGPRGQVICFEPHPKLFDELSRNAARWQDQYEVGVCLLKKLAITNAQGEGMLSVPKDFEVNRGLSSLVSSSTNESLPVSLERLENCLEMTKVVDLLKIDVEGHEFSVCEGAGDWIKQRRIRDIVFEDHEPYPSATARLLESHGYCIFAMRQSFFGPRLDAPNAETGGLRDWETPNYLATADADRAKKRIAPRGWQCLRVTNKEQPRKRDGK
jgi:FkbM family methyltransferase